MVVVKSVTISVQQSVRTEHTIISDIAYILRDMLFPFL